MPKGRYYRLGCGRLTCRRRWAREWDSRTVPTKRPPAGCRRKTRAPAGAGHSGPFVVSTLSSAAPLLGHRCCRRTLLQPGEARAKLLILSLLLDRVVAKLLVLLL